MLYARSGSKKKRAYDWIRQVELYAERDERVHFSIKDRICWQAFPVSLAVNLRCPMAGANDGWISWAERVDIKFSISLTIGPPAISLKLYAAPALSFSKLSRS